VVSWRSILALPVIGSSAVLANFKVELNSSNIILTSELPVPVPRCIPLRLVGYSFDVFSFVGSPLLDSRLSIRRYLSVETVVLNSVSSLLRIAPRIEFSRRQSSLRRRRFTLVWSQEIRSDGIISLFVRTGRRCTYNPKPCCSITGLSRSYSAWIWCSVALKPLTALSASLMLSRKQRDTLSFNDSLNRKIATYTQSAVKQWAANEAKDIEAISNQTKWYTPWNWYRKFTRKDMFDELTLPWSSPRLLTTYNRSAGYFLSRHHKN